MSKDADIKAEIRAALASYKEQLLKKEHQVGGQRIRLDGRMTMVLRRAGDKWLFAHTHFSVPDRGQQEGQSFPKK